MPEISGKNGAVQVFCKSGEHFEFLGSGVLVSATTAVTCAHVVNLLGAGNKARKAVFVRFTPANEAWVEGSGHGEKWFASDDGEFCRVDVEQYTGSDSDIAKLVLAKEVTGELPLIVQADSSEIFELLGSDQHSWCMFGYTSPKHSKQVGKAKLINSVESNETPSEIQITGGVFKGMSGGPALLACKGTTYVFGIISDGGRRSATSRVQLLDAKTNDFLKVAERIKSTCLPRADPGLKLGSLPRLKEYQDRPAIEKQIQDWCVGNDFGVLNIWGMNGIGKSSLLAELAHRSSGSTESWNTANLIALELDGSNYSEVYKKLREIATNQSAELFIADKPSDLTAVFQKNKIRVLFFVDGLEHHQSLSGESVGLGAIESPEILDFLRGVAQGSFASMKVVCSTTHPIYEMVNSEVVGYRDLPVGSFSFESTEHLVKSYGILDQSVEQIEALITFFDGYPLAISLYCSYLKHVGANTIPEGSEFNIHFPAIRPNKLQAKNNAASTRLFRLEQVVANYRKCLPKDTLMVLERVALFSNGVLEELFKKIFCRRNKIQFYCLVFILKIRIGIIWLTTWPFMVRKSRKELLGSYSLLKTISNHANPRFFFPKSLRKKTLSELDKHFQLLEELGLITLSKIGYRAHSSVSLILQKSLPIRETRRIHYAAFKSYSLFAEKMDDDRGLTEAINHARLSEVSEATELSLILTSSFYRGIKNRLGVQRYRENIETVIGRPVNEVPWPARSTLDSMFNHEGLGNFIESELGEDLRDFGASERKRSSSSENKSYFSASERIEKQNLSPNKLYDWLSNGIGAIPIWSLRDLFWMIARSDYLDLKSRLKIASWNVWLRPDCDYTKILLVKVLQDIGGYRLALELSRIVEPGQFNEITFCSAIPCTAHVASPKQAKALLPRPSGFANEYGHIPSNELCSFTLLMSGGELDAAELWIEEAMKQQQESGCHSCTSILNARHIALKRERADIEGALGLIKEITVQMNEHKVIHYSRLELDSLCLSVLQREAWCHLANAQHDQRFVIPEDSDLVTPEITKSLEDAINGEIQEAKFDLFAEAILLEGKLLSMLGDTQVAFDLINCLIFEGLCGRLPVASAYCGSREILAKGLGLLGICKFILSVSCGEIAVKTDLQNEAMIYFRQSERTGQFYFEETIDKPTWVLDVEFALASILKRES